MKLEYHLAFFYPSDKLDAAKDMDRLLWTMVDCSSGPSIPGVDRGRGVEYKLSLDCGKTSVSPITLL